MPQAAQERIAQERHLRQGAVGRMAAQLFAWHQRSRVIVCRGIHELQEQQPRSL